MTRDCYGAAVVYWRNLAVRLLFTWQPDAMVASGLSKNNLPANRSAAFVLDVYKGCARCQTTRRHQAT